MACSTPSKYFRLKYQISDFQLCCCWFKLTVVIRSLLLAQVLVAEQWLFVYCILNLVFSTVTLMENIFCHLPLNSLPKLTGFGIPSGCTEETHPSIPHPNLSLVNKGANERWSFFKRTNHSAVKIGSTVVFPGYLLLWGSPELLEAVWAHALSCWNMFGS